MTSSESKINKGIHILKSEGILALIKAIIIKIEYKLGLFSFLTIPYIKYISRKTDLNQLLTIFFEKRTLIHHLFRPLQIKEEIEELLNILEPMKPKCILEIGTASGGTLFLWTRVASSDATIISIDLPGGRFGGGYPFLRKWVYKSFAKDKQRIILLRENSHNLETLRKVESLVKECGGLDFLFIDGDHSYEGVKKDFEMYSKLVKKGGIIALHDIVQHPPETGCEVNKFWNEIKKDYKHLEIIASPDQQWAGIGVIFF